MDVIQSSESGSGAKSESGKFQSIQNRVFQYLLNEVAVDCDDSRGTRARKVANLVFSSPLFIEESSPYRARLVEQFTSCPDIRQSLAKIAAIFENQVKRAGEKLTEELSRVTRENAYVATNEQVDIASRLSDCAKVLRGLDFMLVEKLVTKINGALGGGKVQFEGIELNHLKVPMAELAFCILGTLNSGDLPYLSKSNAEKAAQAIQSHDLNAAHDQLEMKIDPLELKTQVVEALIITNWISFHKASRFLCLGEGEIGEEELKTLISKGTVTTFREGNNIKFKFMDLIRFKLSQQDM